MAQYLTFFLYVTISIFLAKRYLLSYHEALIVGFLLCAQSFWIESSIFGVSVKIISFAVGVLYILHIYNKNKIKITKEQFLLIALWGGFVLLAALSGVFNGSLRNSSDINDFFGRYVISLVILIIGFVLTSRTNGVMYIAWWLYVVAVINFVFVIGQVLDISFFKDFHEALYIKTANNTLQLINRGEITSYGYAAGLSSYSIGTGYVLGCYGMLGVGLAMRQSGYIRNALVIVPMIIIGFGGVLILSRSTTFFGIILACAAIVLSTKNKINSAIILLFLLIISQFIFAIVLSDLNLNTDRLSSFEDQYREILRRQAVLYIRDNYLVGGFKAAVETGAVDMGAHNFILNGMMYFGIIGFFPLIIFLWFSVMFSVKNIKKTNERDRPLIVAAVFAGFVYTVKSMVHNESLATSGIVYMWVLLVAMGKFKESEF